MKRFLNVLAGSSLAVLAIVSGAAAQQTRAEAIMERLDNANGWRGHVMIVAHRGAVQENGKLVRAENSRDGILGAIRAGAEIVEIDIRRAGDGTLVAMHDSYLDRTTTCRGAVTDFTLEEMSRCRLTVNGAPASSAETVPTLRELLEVARGNIIVNIDNKGEPDDLREIAAAVRELGMAGQVIVKENIWSAERLDMALSLLPDLDGLRFMPILADDAVQEPEFVRQVTDAVRPDLVEMIAWRGEASRPTLDGGALFSRPVRAAAIRGNWHIWVNTFAILNKPGGFLAGGRGDELGISAAFPEEAFGFWIDRGATIIQTDEPAATIAWLEGEGLRLPYPASAGKLADLASQ